MAEEDKKTSEEQTSQEQQVKTDAGEESNVDATSVKTTFDVSQGISADMKKENDIVPDKPAEEMQSEQKVENKEPPAAEKTVQEEQQPDTSQERSADWMDTAKKYGDCVKNIGCKIFNASKKIIHEELHKDADDSGKDNKKDDAA